MRMVVRKMKRNDPAAKTFLSSSAGVCVSLPTQLWCISRPTLKINFMWISLSLTHIHTDTHTLTHSPEQTLRWTSACLHKAAWPFTYRTDRSVSERANCRFELWFMKVRQPEANMRDVPNCWWLGMAGASSAGLLLRLDGMELHWNNRTSALILTASALTCMTWVSISQRNEYVWSHLDEPRPDHVRGRFSVPVFQLLSIVPCIYTVLGMLWHERTFSLCFFFEGSDFM